MFHLLLFFVYYLPAYDDPAVYRLAYASHVATMPRSQRSDASKPPAACPVYQTPKVVKGSR